MTKNIQHFYFFLEPTYLPSYDRPANPCIPNPCGPNSICTLHNSQAVCACASNYVGRPTSCRPECIIDSDCPSTLACLCDKCKDPCPGSCGSNAQCNVVSHRPYCTCLSGFTGDPFTGCNQIVQRKNSESKSYQSTIFAFITYLWSIVSCYVFIVS